MAVIRSNLFTELRNKIADLQFRMRRNRKIELAKKRVPTNKRTEKQQQVRQAYGKCVEMYNKLSEEEKKAYAEKYKSEGLDSYRAFMRDCLKRMLQGMNYEIIIDNTQNSNDLTEHQVLLIVTNDQTFFNTFSNNHKYLEAYDSDKQTVINFFVEEWDTTNYNARIWFKIPLISANSTKAIYLKANFNRTASLSNPNAVFDFYDDFNDLSNWRVVRIGGSGGYAKAEDSYLKLYSTYAFTTVDTPITLQNVRIDTKVKVVSPAEVYHIFVSDGTYQYGKLSNGYSYSWNGWPSSSTRQRITRTINSVDTTLAQTSNGLLQKNVEYILSVIYASPTLKMLNDGTEILSASDSTYSSRSYLALSCYTFGEYWIDWVRVRKYTSPEPTLSYRRL